MGGPCYDFVMVSTLEDESRRIYLTARSTRGGDTDGWRG